MELKKRSANTDALDDSAVDLLFKSAPLHDIGKVGIPDRILLKPGKLEPEGLEIMKKHSILGYDAIVHAEKTLGVGFLNTVKMIARSHHAKWDGTGYPDSLSGAAIPLPARIRAVTDVYDALISRRVYKEGMPPEKAAGIVQAGSGTYFDPDLVETFIVLEPKFRAIAARFVGTDKDFVRL